jgi:hypothetical protein
MPVTLTRDEESSNVENKKIRMLLAVMTTEIGIKLHSKGASNY